MHRPLGGAPCADPGASERHADQLAVHAPLELGERAGGIGGSAWEPRSQGVSKFVFYTGGQGATWSSQLVVLVFVNIAFHEAHLFTKCKFLAFAADSQLFWNMLIRSLPSRFLQMTPKLT